MAGRRISKSGWSELERYHRPILCTEYMARPMGSTFDLILPIAKKHHVAAINWGLVAGKTQTYLPWDSWEKPYVLQKPPVWFHEVFHADGKPYREREAADHSRTDRREVIVRKSDTAGGGATLLLRPYSL